jgi:2-polyprenyl-3-methyl-5-hydroxy-6-metoxy-1,4-benzoquinol methylase
VADSSPSWHSPPVATPHDYFDERIAAYDERSAEMFAPNEVDPVVDFLAHLAKGGAALELGIGTGRIALPLSRRGTPVHGIDLSEAMVRRLKAKPGAQEIGVTIGTSRRRPSTRPSRSPISSTTGSAT